MKAPSTRENRTTRSGFPRVDFGDVERIATRKRSPTDYSECKAANMSVFFHSRHHPSNLLGLLLLAGESVALGSLALELALASGLGAGTLGVHLLLDGLLASLLGLGTVNLQ